MMLHSFPPFTVVQLHPVIFAVLNFTSVLQGLCKEFAEIVIVRSILKPQISHVAEIFVELLCNCNSV